MNIAENLQLLQNTKINIREAILAVGGELEASAPFSAYPEAILALSGDTPTPPTPTPEPTSAVTISSVQDPAFRIDYSGINTGITDCKIGISTSSAMTWDDWSSNNYAYANTHTSSSARSWQMNLGLSRGTFGVERASDDSQQSLQNKLSLKTLSAGTWYVKVWVSYDDWATASAITPVVEVVPAPVQYTYAISMDGGNTFGAGELDGTYDTISGGWVKNYIDLYYGSGDWEQSNFVAAGTVDPSNYSIVNNTGGGGITDYTSGFDSNEGKWYVQANSSTVPYSEQGEFFEIKAQSGNTDISNATLHVNIEVVDQEAADSGEHDEDDWQFVLEDYGVDDGGMFLGDRNAKIITIQYGTDDGGGGFDVQGDLMFGDYMIGLYDVNNGQPSSYSDTSMAENGFELDNSNDVWTIAATSALKWDSVGIAVFTNSDVLKIDTHIDYSPQ